MKSSSTYIKESTSLSDYYVRFVKVKGDAGIMFEGKNGEYEPNDVKSICEAVGLDYTDDKYDSLNVPVYFYNITKNNCGWVERGDCKDL